MSIDNEYIRVLLVEDDPGDIELTKEAFSEAKLKIKIDVVTDGEAALEFIHGRGNYAERVKPDVILLDLNLPKINGKDVLAEIKKDDEHRKIPVVILTTSQAEEDIARSYGLGANCYITKPVGFADFLEVVQSIENFWFNVVKLPK